MPKPRTEQLTRDGKSRNVQNYSGKLHVVFLLMFSTMIIVEIRFGIDGCLDDEFDFSGTGVHLL